MRYLWRSKKYNLGMRHEVLFALALLVFACSSEAGEPDAGTTEAPTAVPVAVKTIEFPPAESPNIQVTVSGAKPGGLAYLVGHFTDQRFRADSTQVGANGQIVFQREEPYERGFYFVWLPDQALIQLILDGDQTMQLAAQVQDPVGTMKVEGSLDNQLLYQNLRFEQQNGPAVEQIAQQMEAAAEGTPAYESAKQQRDDLLAKRKTHLKQFFEEHPNTLFAKFKKAGQNPEVQDVKGADGETDVAMQLKLYRNDFWKNVDFADERLLRTPVVHNKLKRYVMELTPQHPDSLRHSISFLLDQALPYPGYYKFFSNWIALQYDPLKTNLMDPDAIYVHIVQNYMTYDRAFWADSAEVYSLQLRAKEMEGSLLGNQAPNVTSNGPDGKQYSIYDIKSPYILVYMYNPTCEHCMIQTPQLVQFEREWRNKGVSVYAIAIDTEDQEWRNYMKKVGMSNFTNVFDSTNQSIYAKYYVDHTPELYVINPQRKIVAKNIKVNQIAEVIRRDKEKYGN